LLGPLRLVVFKGSLLRNKTIVDEHPPRHGTLFQRRQTPPDRIKQELCSRAVGGTNILSTTGATTTIVCTTLSEHLWRNHAGRLASQAPQLESPCVHQESLIDCGVHWRKNNKKCPTSRPPNWGRNPALKLGPSNKFS
jgi:hypothetical protein